MARAPMRCARRSRRRAGRSRFQLGHGRRRGRDAGDLPARVPPVDGDRRRPRRAARRADRADRAAALFVLLGPRVNAGALPRWRRAAERTASGEQGGWYRLAQALMRRPWPVAIAATALLLVLGLPFLSTRFTGVDASVLPASVSSRVVDTALRKDFPATFVSPAYAVVHGDAAARAYAAAVRRLPDAALVLPRRSSAPGAWEVRAPRARRSSSRPRSGSSTSCAAARRRAGRRLDRAVPRPEAHARRSPAARDRPALRSSRTCSSTGRRARSSSR